MQIKPWVSFCISTYKRPVFIQNQANLLLSQTFGDFEIVISDNDPAASAREPILKLNDKRIRYFHNGDNLGMIKSFNKSIERALGKYVVMVTDDDPVDRNFLSIMFELENKHPDYPLYAGFIRNKKTVGNIEIVKPSEFITEILDPKKTPWILWSSCVILRKAAIKINNIPDYDSPHLADHAFIAMAGTIGGGVIINSAYSSLTSHDSNFSKFNLEYYVKGCRGFYDILSEFSNEHKLGERSSRVIKKHLKVWFISCFFNLKRYYTISRKDTKVLNDLELCSKEILSFPFMKHAAFKFYLKDWIFKAKHILGILS